MQTSEAMFNRRLYSYLLFFVDFINDFSLNLLEPQCYYYDAILYTDLSALKQHITSALKQHVIASNSLP